MKTPIYKEKENISPAVIARLSKYYRYLRTLKEQGVERTSSAALAEMMNLTASQIRQDFNCYGGFGQQGYGYNVEYLFEEISKLLGVEEGYTVAIFGVGNLGMALAHAQTFARRGIEIIDLFDLDEEIIGKEVLGRTVVDAHKFPEYYRSRPFDIAVLCVPKETAQGLAEQLCALGVKGIWNFTGIILKLPKDSDTVVEDIHLGDSLQTLTYKMRKKQK